MNEMVIVDAAITGARSKINGQNKEITIMCELRTLMHNCSHMHGAHSHTYTLNGWYKYSQRHNQLLLQCLTVCVVAAIVVVVYWPDWTGLAEPKNELRCVFECR